MSHRDWIFSIRVSPDSIKNPSNHNVWRITAGLQVFRHQPGRLMILRARFPTGLPLRFQQDGFTIFSSNIEIRIAMNDTHDDLTELTDSIISFLLKDKAEEWARIFGFPMLVWCLPPGSCCDNSTIG
jgi:hypothetical protein